MRIVLVGPVYPYRGGIAHYTTMLCRTLRDRGHDVLMVSFKRQYPQWLFPGKSDKDPSKKPLEVEGARYWIDSLNPLTWLTTFWRMWRFGPDVIVLQWWTSFWAPVWSLIGALTRLLLRRPISFICHNVLPHEAMWYDPALAKLALRWGNVFLVQCEDEKQLLLSILPGVCVTYTPLPVFDLFSDQAVPKAEARRRLDLPADVPTLLFFGIVREYKGLRNLLAALPEVQAQLGSMMLVIAGEFWDDKPAYLRLIRQLGIADSVIIEDRYIPNEEVTLYLSATDVLVAPYQHVTGSAVVKTALAHDCPVIATRVGSLPDAVQDGVTGVLAREGDSHALADAVIRFFREGLDETRRREEIDVELSLEWEHVARIVEETGQKCE